VWREQIETRMTQQLQSSQMRVATLEASLTELKQMHADLAGELAASREQLAARGVELAAAKEAIERLEAEAELTRVELRAHRESGAWLRAAHEKLQGEHAEALAVLAATQVRGLTVIKTCIMFERLRDVLQGTC
jgi:chromosome segregation ATPase